MKSHGHKFAEPSSKALRCCSVSQFDFGVDYRIQDGGSIGGGVDDVVGVFRGPEVGSE